MGRALRVIFTVSRVFLGAPGSAAFLCPSQRSFSSPLVKNSSSFVNIPLPFVRLLLSLLLFLCHHSFSFSFCQGHISSSFCQPSFFSVSLFFSFCQHPSFLDVPFPLPFVNVPSPLFFSTSLFVFHQQPFSSFCQCSFSSSFRQHSFSINVPFPLSPP